MVAHSTGHHPLVRILKRDRQKSDFEARFWRRKLDGIALDVNSKKCFPIGFNRTQDWHTYEERARDRASEQYKSLLEGLQAIGRRTGWKIQQMIFVGGACGSVGQDSGREHIGHDVHA